MASEADGQVPRRAQLHVEIVVGVHLGSLGGQCADILGGEANEAPKLGGGEDPDPLEIAPDIRGQRLPAREVVHRQRTVACE